MTITVEKRQLVAPGELLAEGAYYAGENAYKEGSRIYASRVGLADFVGNKIVVVPLKGFYIPRVDDVVIGKITDVGLSGWSVDINAPYPALLPLSEVGGVHPAQGRQDLRKIFDVGDLLTAQIMIYDRTRDPVLTAKERGLGKVTSGRVVKISPTRIPRLVGRKGSMINMLKKETGCQIVIGQNGVVLISGRSPGSEHVATAAIYMIEREAHTRGLTDRVREMIRRGLGEGLIASP